MYSHVQPDSVYHGFYEAYQIANGGGSLADAWVKADTFTSSNLVLGLGANENGVYHLGSFPTGTTKPAFFFLNATAETATTQSHTIHLYSGKPGAGGVEVASQVFTNTTENSIEASSNKIDDTGSTVSTTTPAVGGDIVVTVKGHTGTIGSAKVLSFTAALHKDWAAKGFRLIGTEISVAGLAAQYDTLVIPTDAATSTADTPYTAKYTFRAVEATSGTTATSPSGHISSGTQVKHTSDSSFGNIPLIQPVVNYTTIAASMSPSSVGASGTSTVTVTLTNTGSTDVTLDDVVATLQSGLSYGGSPTYAGSSISAPIVSGQVVTFVYPFAVPAGTSRTLTFVVTAPAAMGSYTVTPIAHSGDTVISTDGNGVTAQATVSVTTPPVASIDTKPALTTSSATGTFTFSADKPATFECSLDGGDYESCASGKSYSGLADGSHTFSVRGINGAGTGPSASYTWTVALPPPPTGTIDSGPSGTATSPDATFELSSDDPGATFECKLDDGNWTPCTSPASFQDLPDGEHTFSFRATGDGGTSEPVTQTWTIDTTTPDTTAPVVAITSGPSGTVAETSAELAFASDDPDATYECKLDDGEWAECTSPAGYADLVDGEHAFSVRASDGSGNVSDPDNRTWTVDTSVEPVPDTTAPTVHILSGPDASTSSTGASLLFAADEDATYLCSLDGAGYASCETPKDYSGLAIGGHTFSVEAVDEAGNVSAPATWSWTVVFAVWIVSAPDPHTHATYAHITFASNLPSATFQCSLDGAKWKRCTAPANLTKLKVKAHTFRVRAVNGAGQQTTPASVTWTIVKKAKK